MTETAKKEPSEDREASFWASFTRADMRLLIVTFAGTVAANVITVLVVAVAVIVARSSITTSRPTQGAVILYSVYAVCGLLAIGTGIYYIRKWGRGHTNRTDRVLKLTVAGIVVIAVLFTLQLLLILVGFAIGVK